MIETLPATEMHRLVPMKVQFAEKHSDFLLSAAIVLFFATLSALALYAASMIDQPDLFL